MTAIDVDRAELASETAAEGPQRPTRADLEAATGATAAALADPAAARAEVDHLIEMESATYNACPDDVVAEYEAETEAEFEL